MFRFWRNWWWVVAFLLVDLWFALWWLGPRRDRILEREAQADAGRSAEAAAAVAAAAEAAAQAAERERLAPITVGYPTAQHGLDRHEDHTVFMATASGRIESAHYGSTRTRSNGLASFHEGIDIAPLERDRRNRALDLVLAVADGRVGYANRVVGNSNYGLYVVLEHQDAIGTIYTLYAHLRKIEDFVKPGATIKRGDVIGVMGNTPSGIIPVVRSHLHIEVGVIQNQNFPAWTASEKIRNLHGIHHGWNLTGIQPLALYSNADAVQPFSMLGYLETVPVAVELLIEADREVDYFVRYPALWSGSGDPVGRMVLSVSEGGVILRGRPADPGEGHGSRLPAVLRVDSDVLGRNGLRLVVQRGGNWQLGSFGVRWLAILLR